MRRQKEETAWETYHSYEEALIWNHILPAFRDMKLTEFSTKMITALYSRMRKQRKMIPQILSSIHKLLHSTFEHEVFWKYVDRNPFHKATLPKSFPCPTKMLSNEEIKKLLYHSVFFLLGIVVHLAFAGSLRKREILALIWSDVDFENGMIFINKTLKRVLRDAIQALDRNAILYQFPAAFEEGRTVIVSKRPKTWSSIRSVYLPPHVDRSTPRLEKGTDSLWKEYSGSNPSVFFLKTVTGRGIPKNAGKVAFYIRAP